MRKILLSAVMVFGGAECLNAASKKMENGSIQPMVVQGLFEQAKKNPNWKMALTTGKYEQVVFMNISPATNPKNEIGEEIHPFDQVILIVQGKANAVLNANSTPVNEGDMIFVPAGTKHNVVNIGKKELKIISFYSATDIPAGAIYETKEKAIE